jgi:hypothetical protein
MRPILVGTTTAAANPILLLLQNWATDLGAMQLAARAQYK